MPYVENREYDPGYNLEEKSPGYDNFPAEPNIKAMDNVQERS